MAGNSLWDPLVERDPWDSPGARSRELQRLLDATDSGSVSLEALAAALADYAATAPHRLTERVALHGDVDAA